MAQIINTNLISLNAQRNLSSGTNNSLSTADAAPVERSSRQQREGRRGRPGDRRAHERAGARHERRDAQRQRRHLDGADRRRRTRTGVRHRAADARAGGAGDERDQRRRRPRQPRHRVPAAGRRRSTRTIGGTQFNGNAILVGRRRCARASRSVPAPPPTTRSRSRPTTWLGRRQRSRP